MNQDLFHIALHRDIYHTLSLWSLLSPGLASRKKTKLSSAADNAATPEIKGGEDKSSVAES